MSCAICGASTADLGLGTDGRRALQCAYCGFIAIRAADRPTPSQAQRRYLLHRNELDDRGYRAYLHSFLEHTMFLYAGVGRGADVGYRTGLGYRTGRGRRRGREIPTRARVLDFGSGPNPVLARILQALGCKVWTWDPYFQRGGGSRRDGGDSWRGGGPRRNGEGTERPGLEAFDAELAARSFDWIVLHEVLEHIFEPARTLRLLSTYLAPGGRVAISTRFAPANPEGSVSARTFASWWYRLDLTHVSFFGPKSLELLGSACGMSLVSAVYPRFAVLRRIV